MTTVTYYDRETLEYHRHWHDHDTLEKTLDDLDQDDSGGYCRCCGVDYTGLNRDDLPDDYQEAPLDPHPWTPGLNGDDPEYAQGCVDFDNEEGRTVATVRITRAGDGYAVYIDQMNDLDGLTIIHTNE